MCCKVPGKSSASSSDRKAPRAAIGRGRRAESALPGRAVGCCPGPRPVQGGFPASPVPYLTPMRTRIVLAALLTLIVVAHIGLWMSDRMPAEMKLRFTIINVLGWSVVLLPAYGVSRWLAAREAERDPSDR